MIIVMLPINDFAFIGSVHVYAAEVEGDADCNVTDSVDNSDNTSSVNNNPNPAVIDENNNSDEELTDSSQLNLTGENDNNTEENYVPEMEDDDNTDGAEKITDENAVYENNPATGSDINDTVETNLSNVGNATNAVNETEEDILDAEQNVDIDVLEIRSDYTLSSNMAVNSVNITSGTLNLNGYTLIVYDSFTLSGFGIVLYNNGMILCYGDYVCEGNHCRNKMNNTNDTLVVYGDAIITTMYTKDINNGVIELKGNLTVRDMSFYDDNHIIFSGSAIQKIITSDNTCFACIENKNESNEGVVCDSILNIGSYIADSAKIYYKDNLLSHGFDLKEDTVIEGDYLLGYGTVNLNGYSLTINGSLINIAGCININGGKLLVKGDYIGGKPSDDLYDYNTYVGGPSKLYMHTDNDYILIEGSFVCKSSVDNSDMLSAGILEIKGNIDLYTFDKGKVPCVDNHTIVLSGRDVQNVRWGQDNTKTNINNLTITNENGIVFLDVPFIKGVITDNGNKSSGYIKLYIMTVFNGNSFNGDVLVDRDFSFDDELHIGGNVIVRSPWVDCSLDAPIVNVDGDLQIENSCFVINSDYNIGGDIVIVAQNDYAKILHKQGIVNVNGNIVLESDGSRKTSNYNQIEYTNTNSNTSELNIIGDITMNDSTCCFTCTKGIINVHGNIDGGKFACSGSSALNFIGSETQIVDVLKESKFAIINLLNDKGIVFNDYYSINEFNRNGNDVKFAEFNGFFGEKLEKDIVIDSDYILLGDMLDLNGYTMTVNGNMLQYAGVVNLNGGTLIINGDYKLEIENDGDIQPSTGYIIMRSGEDKIYVKGDFVNHSSCSVANNLSAGLLDITGNFKVYSTADKSFNCTGNHTIVLSGENDQHISFEGSNAQRCIRNLTMINHEGKTVFFEEGYSPYVSGMISDGGCTIVGSFYAYKTTFDNNIYHGDVRLATYFSSFVTIYGDLISDIDDAHINGVVNVYGDFNIVSGKVISYGDISIDGDINIGVKDQTSGNLEIYYETISANNLNIYQGNLTFNENYTTGEMIINNDIDILSGSIKGKVGTLICGGNITSKDSIFLENQNRCILNGNKLQVVDVLDNSMFGILDIQNSSSEGVMCKYVYKVNQLICNGNRFTYDNIEGIFGYTLNEDTIVDGDLIILGDTLDLNGYSITVKGDVIQYAGAVDINRGSMTVEGSYRLEKDNGADRISTGYFILDNPEDYLLINGDLYNNSIADTTGKITDGVIEVKGDIYSKSNIIYSNNSINGYYMNFVCEGNNTIILSGTDNQTVSIDYSYFTSSHLNNLKITNENRCITYPKDNEPCVAGCITDEGNNNEGVIRIGNGTQITGNTYYGNIDIYESSTLDNELTIYGDVHLTGITHVQSDVNIYGNLYIRSNYNYIENGQLYVSGNINSVTQYANTYFEIRFCNNESQIICDGNINMAAKSYFIGDCGTLILKGNLTNTSMRFTGEHKFIIAGDKEQRICGGSYGIISVENASEEGTCFVSMPTYNLMLMNGCRVRISDMDYQGGMSLTGDTIYDGNYNLIGGNIELNGYELVVTGDLNIAGGKLDIGSGHLTVNGNLRIQGISYNNYMQVTYTDTKGYIVMNDNKGCIEVNGDMYVQQGNGVTNELSDGTIVLRGTFKQFGSNPFVTTDKHTVIFDGDKTKSIYNNTKSEFANIINKTNVTLSSSIYVSGQVKDEGTFGGSGYIYIDSADAITGNKISGNVILTSEDVLADNLSVGGELCLKAPLSIDNVFLNAGSLCIEDKLYIGTGNLSISNMLNIESDGYIVMDNSGGYILCEGNINDRSDIDYDNYLTTGVIEVRGNVNKTGNGKLESTSDHVVILSNKYTSSGRVYRQIININDSNKVDLNKLVVKKDSDDYSSNVSLDLIAKEVIYEDTDTSAPTAVKYIESYDVKENSISIRYTGAEDDKGILGYEIYRDGVLIGISSKDSYVDTTVLPSTIYSYKVYAFDIDRNKAISSPEVKVSTGGDTTPPTVPEGLYIASRSASALTIAWDDATDNIGVEQYIIYIDGVEKARVQADNRTYKAEELTVGRTYGISVCAVDEAGNVSPKSEEIEGYVLKSVFTDISPVPGNELPSGNIELRIGFDNNTTGNLKGTIEILNNTDNDTDNETDDDYEIIADNLTAVRDRDNKYHYLYSLDTTRYSDEDKITLRFTLEDEDGNKERETVSYFIDNTPLANVTDLKAESVNGVNYISFNPSEDGDAIGYEIYRQINGEESVPELITTIDDRFVNTYIDRETVEDMVYTYAVITCGIYGQKSEMLSTESINTSADEDVPSITEMSPSGGTYGGNIRIDIKAEDNKKIDRIGLEYRKEGDSDYTLIKELYAPNNNISFNIDTALYDDGIYYYNAYAIDASGNRSDEYIRRYIYDNTGIQKITGLEAECGVNNVCLYWEDVTDEDFAYFDVEKYVHDRFVSVRHVDDKTYAYIEGLEPGSEYEFRVTGVDVYGNRGESSDSITVNTLNDEKAPYISGIYPSNEHGYNNEIELKIYAEDVSGIAKGIFEYSTDGKEYVTIEEKAVGGKKQCEISAILDVKPFDEGNLYIKYKAEDIYGNISSDEESIVNVISIDKTAPGKVNPDIVSSDGVVIFSGKPDDNDIYYYEIYRAESINGIYAYIDSTDSIDGYTDTDVIPDKSYYYKVKAVDYAGNKSEYSNIAATYVKRDDQKPQILDVYPDNGGYIGQNSEIYVSASDNNKLSEVVLMYKKEGSVQYEKEFFGNINESYINAKFNIDTAYLSDGVYNFYAYAVDINGNESSKYVFEYNIDTNAPVINNLEAITGHYSIDVIIDSDDDDVQYYDIYRRESGKYAFDKIATIEGTTYHDADVKPGVPYIYKVIAVDKAGNASEEVQTTGYADDVDEIAPVAVIGENIMAITGYEISLDAYESYDNVRIVSYKWDMGNGDVVEGVRAKYTYEKSGEYNVTLTVYDASGNSGKTSFVIKVHDNSGYGMSILNVTDENGNVLPFASVYLKYGNDAYHLKTDSTGKVVIVQRSGIAKVAAYLDGYLPSQMDITISEYKTYEYNLALKKDDLIIGNMQVRRMTLSEMKEAGVDLSNSANYNYFVFSYDFVFERRTITIHNAPIVSGIPGRGGKSINIRGGAGTGNGITGSTPAGNSVYIEPIYYDETMPAPILACAHISNTEDMEWLKDMFNVSLSIYNNADNNYYIDNSVATISLPQGLSLAALINEQDADIQMGTIGGQEEKDASWIVRGDENGTYTIGADFHGILMPFECDVNVHFDCESEVYVRAGEGIHIVLMPESTGYMGHNYYVQYKIINESSYPIYNFKTSIGAYEAATPEYIVANIDDGTTTSYSGTVKRNPNAKSYTLSEGGYVTYSCIEPGEVIYGTYKTSFPFANPDDDITVHYYELVDSIVDYSENLGIKITVEPIASHIGRQIIGGAYAYNSLTVGDPIDVRSGAFTDELYVPSVNSAADINFKATYSSDETDICGLLGYGWRYVYDAHLSETSGIIRVSLGDTHNAMFINENMSQDVIYGAVIDNTLVLSDDIRTTYGSYIPMGDSLTDCNLIKDEKGYTLYLRDDKIYNFDFGGNLITVADSKGRSVVFTYDNDNVKVTDSATGLYITYHQNERGLIDKVTDIGGRTTYLMYDDNDNLITYVLPDDNAAIIQYDEEHRIVSERNAQGTYVTNVYDVNDRVVSQTDGLNNTIGMSYMTYDTYREVRYTGASGYEESYIYDNNNNLIKFISQNGGIYEYIYDSNGNEIFDRDPNGNVIEKSYDDNGNILSYTDRNYNTTTMTYDECGNILSVTGADGSSAHYSYDNNGNITSMTDLGGVVTTNTYDSNGNLVVQSTGNKKGVTYAYTNGLLTLATDSLGNVSRSTYDIYGNLESVTDALGNVTSYTYDNMNRLKSVTDACGNKVTYSYDLNGNIVSYVDAAGNETKYAYDVSGNNTKITYPDNTKIIYDYDIDNRLTQISYPDGTYERRVYDVAGNLVKKEQSDGSYVCFNYDLIGQLIEKRDSSGIYERYEYYPNGNLYKTEYSDGSYILNTYNNRWQLISITDNNGDGISYGYDVKGNMTSMTDQEGHKSLYEYDEYGRLISETDPNGNKTSYSYDDNDNPVKKTDALGNSIYLDYDALGRCVSAYAYDKSGEKYETRYGYDALGRVIYTIDEEGIKSYISYDVNGNICSTGDNSSNTTSSLKYDSMGRLSESTDISNTKTTYAYDNMGRLTKAVTVLGNKTRTSAYTYDERGNLIKTIENGGITSSVSYDNRGNINDITDPNGGVTKYTYDSMDRVLSVKSPLGFATSYSYNAAGLLDTFTNANGQKTTYTYDKCGRIASFTDEIGTVRYTYDNNGNVLKASDENGTITRTYDALNRVTSVTDYNGKTVKYAYDELGHLVSLTYPGGEIVRYQYYRNGKIKAVIDVNGDRTEYSYDENGRLAETVRPNNTKEIRTYENGNLVAIRDVLTDVNGQEISVINDYHYTYDLAGNITKITGEETDEEGLSNLVSAVCTYDADNRLITYNGETIKYDNNGNMTYGPVDGKMMSLTYDCRNRLIKAGRDTYTYDAENIRISTKHADSLDIYVTERVSELNRVVVKTTYKTIGNKISSNYNERLYIYGNGLVSEVEDNNTIYHHYNHLGSTTKLTDKTGKVIQTYSYGPYGELLSGDKSYTDYLYNGIAGVITEDNGLYYMRQRYYNPEIKRFINQDIITGSITNPKSLNRYAYVQGNPVSYVDPFGLSPSNVEDGYNLGLGLSHIFFGVLGFVPGPVGVAANLADAVLYAFVDHDYFACTLSLLGAATCGFASAAKTGLMAKTVCTVCSVTSATMVTAKAGYDIGNELSDIMDCYVFHETSPEELNLGSKLLSIGINTFTIGVSALSVHLTMSEYQKALNNASQSTNITEKATWVNTEAFDDVASKADDVMIEVRNSSSAMIAEYSSTELVVYDPKFATKQLLESGTVSEYSLKSIIPNNVPNTFVPSSTITEGYKYKFSINDINLEIKWHSPDFRAASKYPGCNSGCGWTAQIKVDDYLLTQGGGFVIKPNNYTHIPLKGGF